MCNGQCTCQNNDRVLELSLEKKDVSDFKEFLKKNPCISYHDMVVKAKQLGYRSVDKMNLLDVIEEIRPDINEEARWNCQFSSSCRFG